ncbi:MAG: helix-turn-helix transcriptional regulator [Pseudomonadales bacterium]|nr:helix-turn-helix transcriptional regulator [Pseudomonadales bacterium]
MNNVSKIRRLFGLSQKDFGEAIGVTQGNVSHYEQGRQEMPPAVARRVIAAASERGLALRWDDIYGDPAAVPSDATEHHEAA